MNVDLILKTKGTDVATIAPDASIAEASRELKRNKIGALVVSPDGRKVVGMLSERDIAYGIAEHGSGLEAVKVARLMASDVITCTPEDTVDSLMDTMTNRRIRHLPVVKDGALAGIVSIGDVVKYRLEEIEHEAEAMRQYIAGT